MCKKPVIPKFRVSAQASFSFIFTVAVTSFLLSANALLGNSVVSWGRQVLPPPEDLNAMIDISAGDGFNLALRTRGRVVAWGANNYRQATIPENLGSIVSIDAGAAHALALRSDGTVVAWGNNRNGQTDIPEGLAEVVAISAGNTHNVALRSDGSIVTWGGNENGQLDFPVNPGWVTAISAGRDHTLALLSNGTVIGWGLDSDGQATVPEEMTNVVAVSAGGSHSLALLNNGSVIGWGNNDFGQITIPDFPAPVKQIRSGTDHNLALLSNGQIVTWGRNHYGQIDIPPNLPPVERIAAGADHSVVVFRDGTFAAWGRNDFGQTLNLDQLSSAVALSSWGNHTIVLREDGTVFWWGAYLSSGVAPDPDKLQNIIAVAAGRAHGLALKADGTVVGWGDNFYGQATPPDGLTGVVAIATGAYHSLAVRDNGTVVAWGNPFQGQIVVPAGLNEVISVAGGRDHSLALTVGGLVFAWGNDFQGQLRVPALLDNVVQIAAGSLHSLALRRDGTVTGWGNNLFGQTVPPAGLSDVIDIDASRSHSVAIRENHTFSGWGGNYYQQSEAPANLGNIIAVAAGSGRTTVITGTPEAPRFISNLDSTSVPAGEDLFIMPRITGTPPLIFQWMKEGQPIEGARGPALSLKKVGAQDSGSYALVVANRAGNSTSHSFSIQVIDPSVAIDLNPAIASLDETVTFRAFAQGTAPFEYQWRKDGEPIEGKTESVLTIEKAEDQDAGHYSVEVSNEHGSVTSKTAELLIFPGIKKQPPPKIVARIGERLLLQIETYGSEPREIQWLKEAVPVTDGDSPELLLENIDVEDGGIYSAIISNRAGTIKSEPTAIEILPLITYQPESQFFSSFGGTAIFDVRAIGTPPLTYRWMKDGKLFLETDDPRLVIDQITGEDGGEYRVIVANPAGEVESEPASLLVPPFISQHPRSKTVRAGDEVEFEVKAVGKDPFEYQWMKNGQPIPGETGPSLHLQDTKGEDSARYTVKVSNEVGEITSEDALLSISPNILTPPETTTATAGSDVTFFVEAEGTRPLHYQWTKNGNTLPNGNQASLTLTRINSEDAGFYSVIVSNAAGIAISESASLQIE